MDISTLNERKLISVRAYNVCLNQGFDTTEDLQNHLQNNHDFKHLKNCGTGTNDELIQLARIGDSKPCEFIDDTEIYWLYDNKKISFASLKLCNENGFENIGDLKKYLLNHSDFRALNLGSHKASSELVLITKIGEEEERQDLSLLESVKEIKVSSLYKRNKISVRAYNVCISNDLTTIGKVYDYLNKNGSFYSLPNCGSKTNDEILSLVRLKESNIFQNSGIFNHDEKTNYEKYSYISDYKETMLEIVNSLSISDRRLINEFIEFLLNSLSLRTQSLLTEYYAHDYRVKSVLRKKEVIEGVFTENAIKSGSKSYKEIRYFYEQLYINIDLAKNNPSGMKEQLIEILANKSKVEKKLADSLNLYNHTGLKVVSMLIENNFVFGDKTELNLMCLNIYEDFQNKTLEEVGVIFDVTRERIRQIRLKGLKQLDDTLKGIRSVFSANLFNEWVCNDEDIIEITEDIVYKINSTYGVSFSKEFIIYLYSILLEDHEIIPNIDVGLLANLQGQGAEYFKSYYLINKSQACKLDFGSMIKDIKRRKEEKIEEDYYLSFNNYLSGFLEEGEELDNTTISICETLVMEETGLFLNSYDEIEFKKNILKTVPDYAYEMLKEIGKPSKIDDIYKALLEKYPTFDKSENTFRNSFKQNSVFVAMGRRSIWGLKEWEGERDDFLGGSMLEITEKFLKESKNPVHISEISDHISKYRDVDEARLMSNLKFNNSRGFVFFKKQYVGLVSKNYPDDFQVLERENRTWDESYLSLIQFIKDNNRIPRSNDSDDDSARIYRWYGIQRKKAIKAKLESEKLEKIKYIIVNYDERSIYE
ncbi:sigma factor-like helix-turn-helix DNA-binding protein [Psychrobacter faecalis]|uniref:sigma factor-like helix-turn-helix DNA-binding protein n=1 Tax=Psychrobacter faecalis TaxID=180588 RepID=UPI003FD24141